MRQNSQGKETDVSLVRIAPNDITLEEEKLNEIFLSSHSQTGTARTEQKGPLVLSISSALLPTSEGFSCCRCFVLNGTFGTT